ncbi:helix-turn-helix domain-containing protein [Chitinophaga rhizosphaerae]|uniref:helix-turn-helix domain-containing protein n=1 Tax=Chitinophaga rhizosphaerae TaxID=1864947 RepID=UPI00196A98D4|nr:helix-turn-helix transcriptional regulator [Chitinophaga rhizosphaerae]
MANNYYRDEDFIKKFGLRLKEIRKFKKMSQEELAFKCGFELSQIGRIERGTINTSISHVAAIARALEVAPYKLFEFEPD